jgi:hypothetical protein
MRIALLCSIIALSACTPPVWIGKPASEWKKDEYECDREVSAQRDPFFQADMWRRCMEVRGWRRS